MGCSQGCKDEFKRSNFLLGYDRPQHLVTTQWACCGCCDIFYVVYRILIAIALAAMLIATAVEYRQGGKVGKEELWFIYLTNWAFLTLTIAVIIEAIVVIYTFFNTRGKKDSWSPQEEKVDAVVMPWYLKMSWVITNIASGLAIVVTLVYWILLYEGEFVTYSNFFVHGFNSVYVLVNVFITAMPCRVYHAFHLLIYGIVYVIFSAIYQLAGDQDPIYPIMDWTKPGTTAIYSLGMLILAIVAWLLYYAFYRIRLAIFLCLEKLSNKVDTEEGVQKVELGHTNPAYVE